MKEYSKVLSIAGSDSGGGAGIQADIKTIQACGSYASTAITAITAQNTLGVESVFPLPLDIVSAQIRAVLSDIGANAVKTGMLHSKEVIEQVAILLEEHEIKNLVVDPVMISTSGHRLLEEQAISALINSLAPLATLITPNIPEAEILVGKNINSQKDFKTIAVELSNILSSKGVKKVSVLLKAGHAEGDELIDLLYNAQTEEFIELRSDKVYTRNTHGTGCTLSAAISAFLSQGYSLNDAVIKAKDYLSQAIINGASYKIGSGFGPVKF